MSFGFSIGDFLALIQLANDIKRNFSGAPEQYQAIAAEVNNFSLVLKDIETYLSTHSISPSQNTKLWSILETGFKTLKDIEKAISKTSVLDSQTSSLRERTRRIWERVKWNAQEIRDFRDRIVSIVVSLNALANSFDREHLATLVVNTSRLLDQQASREILDWLAPPDYAAQHAIITSQRLPGTGEWLLDAAVYKDWLNSTSDACSGNSTDHTILDSGDRLLNIILLQGIPGVGKTLLSSICIDNLRHIYHDMDDIGICYYYCDYNRQRSREVEAVLASLLRQLAQVTSTGLSTSLVNLFNSHNRQNMRPQISELREALYLTAKSFKTIYVIIDALDECQSSDGTRRMIISELFQLHKSTSAHLLFTSRPLPDITNSFHNCISIDIRANDHDVSKFILSSIPTLPNFVMRSPDLQKEIVQAIIAAADGIFLLAVLHTQALQGARSVRAIRTALESFAKGVSGYSTAYANTMGRICSQVKDQKELAIDALMWIVYAERALNSDELLHALAIVVDTPIFDEDNVPDIEDVISACCGLLVVEKDTDLLRLVHRTTQEYLKENHSTWFDRPQTKISKICNTYISCVVSSAKPANGDETFGAESTRFPFFNYASLHGLQHARMRETSMTIEELVTMQDHSNISTQIIRDPIVSQYLDLTFENPGFTGLNLLARCGAYKLMPHFVDKYDINAIDKLHNTPISYAIQHSNIEIVEILVRHGAQLNIPDGNGQPPLHQAILRRDEEITEILVRHGAQLNVPNENGQLPLHQAVLKGTEEIAKLLLDQGADVNSANSSGRTALSLAAGECQLGLTKLFLKHDCDPFLVDIVGRTPLSYSAENYWGSSKDVLQHLLEHMLDLPRLEDIQHNFPPSNLRARIHGPDAHGNAPIIYAARHGYGNAFVEKVSMLLDCGAEINVCDEQKRSLLSILAEGSSPDLVERLLVEGAQINQEDDTGSTALFYAISRGNKDIVELLLKRGAQVDHFNRSNETPLFWTLKFRSDNTNGVLLLLKYGAQIDQRDKIGRTPFLLALDYRYTSTAEILIQQGANVRLVDNRGQTALHLAANDGKVEMFSRIIAAGVDPAARDRRGMGILEYASNSNSIQMLTHVIQDLPLNGSLGSGPISWSALHWVCLRGSFEMLRLLIENGIKVTTICTQQPTATWTPLDIAVYWNNLQLLTPESTLRPDLAWEDLIDSGIVVSNTQTKTIEMFRMNDKGPGSRSFTKCDVCGNDGMGVDFIGTENKSRYVRLCLLCKHDSDHIYPGYEWEVY